jgi:hypothetical protein
VLSRRHFGLAGCCSLSLGAARRQAHGRSADTEREQGDCYQSPLLRPCLQRVRFQKNVYASAIGLGKTLVWLRGKVLGLATGR